MTWAFNFGYVVVHIMITTSKGNMDSWPQGQYGLLKPKTGCPVGWPQKTGWIYQDTEDTNPSNNHSQILHIEGWVGASYVLRSFCLKTVSSGIPWPKGQYCVYNKYFSSCPAGSGLLTGSIIWDDENTNNSNTVKTPLPYHNNYKKNLRLAFCCSTTGSKSSPIQLPITKPFYLLPSGSTKCQQVEWMLASLEWITYDKENTGTDYSEQTGELPYYTLNQDRDITMYYCYYKSCNYTLETSKGSFQSPSYPNNYTDGQRCSWKIIAPVNHTILVTFVTFSMAPNNDTLDYYTQSNGSYQLARRYHSDDVPEIVTSESNEVMFVFRSDVQNTSRGFRAEYEVFPIEDIYTTAKAFTTSTTGITVTMQFESTEHASTVTPTTSSENVPPAKAAGLKDDSTILLIVIPLVCFVLIVVVVIDIWYRCKIRKCRHGDEKMQLNPDIAVNDIYECEMIVSQCSNITRPTVQKTAGHYDREDDIYQNTNEGYYSDEIQYNNTNTPTQPTLPRTRSQPNDYHTQESCDSNDNPVHIGMKELVPQGITEAEYGNVDSPRVVSGEYSYLQPLEYVPQNDTDDTSINTNGPDTASHTKHNRNDSDASDQEPLEYGSDGNQGGDIRDIMDTDEPIYEYDNVCEPLGYHDDIYANVD